VMMM
jgi:exodeoxyribonuclease V alpha subunit